MNSAAKAHEPSMEEILASIRRIISDDDQPGAAKATSKPAAQPAPQPVEAEPAGADLGQDDIDAMFAAMDQAQAEAPAAAPSSPAPVEFQDDLDVLELTEEVEEPAPAAPAPPPPVAARPAPTPPRPQPASAAVSDRLLSAEANEAVSGAFGSLANTILAGNARTLDDIVREMLRPMLRAWLDDNLPPLVERLVRAEIERVARGGR